jgi:hypothetical protein
MGRLSLDLNMTTGDIVVRLNGDDLFFNSDVFLHRRGERLSLAEGTLRISTLNPISG